MATGLVTMALLATFSAALPASGETRAKTATSARAVTLHVKNTNTSLVPCASDGVAYDLPGHLIGPKSPGSKAVTVYLHGFGLGEWFWNLDAVPSRNYAIAQARAGHTSLVFDRLGYDSSPHPHGDQICLGSQADMAHQVIQALRGGSYAIERGAPTAFKRVALAGHSAGSQIANLEAYSYRDIDALIVIGYAHQVSRLGFDTFYAQAGVCNAGGAATDGMGPNGYAYYGQSAEDFKRGFFHDARASVVNAAVALRNLDPCGDVDSFPAAIIKDKPMLPTVRIPVLTVCGRNDLLFVAPSCDRLGHEYTGSRDRSVAFVPNSGHALTLDRGASTFRSKMHRWLRRHKL